MKCLDFKECTANCNLISKKRSRIPFWMQYEVRIGIVCPDLCPLCVQISAPCVSRSLPPVCPDICPLCVQISAPCVSRYLPPVCPDLCPLCVQISSPCVSRSLPPVCPDLCPLYVQISAPCVSRSCVQISAPCVARSLPPLCPLCGQISAPSCIISHRFEGVFDKCRSSISPESVVGHTLSHW